MGSGLRKHSLAGHPPLSVTAVNMHPPLSTTGGGRCLCNSTDTAAFALIARLVPLRESGGAQPRAGSRSQDPRYPGGPLFRASHQRIDKHGFAQAIFNFQIE